jgi:hypothetical protein
MPTPPDFTAGTALAAASLNKVGLWYITSVNMGGTININNIFSSDFDNYRLVFENLSHSGAQGVGVRLRKGTTTNIANSYSAAGIYRLFAGGGGDSIINNVSLWYWFTVSTTPISAGVIDIYGPALSRFTNFTLDGVNFDAAQVLGGVHKVTDSYDGLTIYDCNAGKLTVYGYNNG